MIIGVSGKLQSGKDTVAKIIQYLCDPTVNKTIYSFENWNKLDVGNEGHINWKIVRFADKLKDIVCLLTSCTREQLEDNEFKNSKLPIQWIRYGYADGFIKKYIGNGEMGEPIMNNK
jgi:hypothetical protein